MTSGLRADAARNLELILEAAEAAFAEKGHEACVADIAARAGVGQATIFRRFETKDDLILAVFERKIAQVHDTVLAAQRKRSAWDGLTELMATVTQMYMRDRGFFQSFAERLADSERLRARKLETTAALEDLLERAKAEGALRSEIKVEDIPPLCAAAAQAAAMTADANTRGWKRYLRVITDGMRA